MFTIHATPNKENKIDDLPTFQNVNPTTLEQFRSLVNTTDWDEIYNLGNPDDAYDTFLTTFTRIYNIAFKYQPIRPKRSRQKTWITRKCLKIIRKKNRLYGNFLKIRDILVIYAVLKPIEIGWQRFWESWKITIFCAYLMVT